GAFGTALAAVAARAGRPVLLYGRDAGVIDEIRRHRTHSRALPGLTLPDGIAATDDLAQAASAAVLILAVPTQALRAAATSLAPHVARGVPVIAAAKGIELATGRFVTDILGEVLADAESAILSGPSFAADIVSGLPTAVTLAAHDGRRAEQLAAAVSGPAFRIYHSDDVIGVAVGGAAKNVLAIAAGIVIGAGLGESARAALIARGFAELGRLATALGARRETLMGLSGLGDLVLTAASPQSRNFSFGLRLGEGRPPAELLAGGKLAEGAATAPALASLARRHGVEMPISEAVAAVLDGRLSVAAAIQALLARPSRGE
ncbi:MAG TPA: NAD(P)H-dependent glycerol-3-phosphate dehydrogenase, partial [Beijerinckiaceae bacterium]|nr:NAD(P)H-dependent glycerol-3-phosphate dehydrogenase [Beijerinckiaceae bacterium]